MTKTVRIVISIGLLLLLTSTIRACAQEKLPSSKLHSYADIFQLMEDYSIFDLTKEDLVKIHECILEKAFLRSEAAESRFFLQSCFAEDPFADYYTPAQVKTMQMRRQGVFYGIGTNLVLDEKDPVGLVIVDFIENGLAEKEGVLQKGDKIIAAGESEDILKEFGGLSKAEMFNLIRSLHKSRVFLKIRRGSQTITVSAGRDRVVFIKTESSILEPGIGYLKIKVFEDLNLVRDEIESALRDFAFKGVRGLVLDLRDNPGGEVARVKEFLDLFAPAPNLLMFESRGRPGSKEKQESYFSWGPGFYAHWKIAILVNGNSASAAEIAAGVLRFWGHKLIGAKTYGKGSMQTRINLSDGGLFKLTTSRYYFSDKSTPDKQGIVPDIVEEDPAAQFKKAIEYLREQLQIIDKAVP